MSIVIDFLVFYYISLNSSLVPLKNRPEYLTRSASQVIYLFDEISAGELASEKLSCSFLIHFAYFSVVPAFFYVVHLQCSRELVIFFFPLYSNSFLVWPVYPVRCFPFSLWASGFFNAKFNPYILAVYSNCFYLSLYFCFYFIFACALNTYSYMTPLIFSWDF